MKTFLFFAVGIAIFDIILSSEEQKQARYDREFAEIAANYE